MNNASREALIAAVRQELIPKIVREGFRERSGAGDAKRNSKEYLMAFPLPHFVRSKGSQVELIEIQFDKRGAPSFLLNFGVIPENGVTLPWGHFGQDVVGVASLEMACRLYSYPFFLMWFALGNFPGDVTHRAAVKAQRAANFLPEVFRWFETFEKGPHLRSFGSGGARFAQ